MARSPKNLAHHKVSRHHKSHHKSHHKVSQHQLHQSEYYDYIVGAYAFRIRKDAPLAVTMNASRWAHMLEYHIPISFELYKRIAHFYVPEPRRIHSFKRVYLAEVDLYFIPPNFAVSLSFLESI